MHRADCQILRGAYCSARASWQAAGCLWMHLQHDPSLDVLNPGSAPGSYRVAGFQISVYRT